MQFSLQTIKLAQVDWDDLTFVVSYGFTLEKLTASIRTLGLLAPPLLRLQRNGSYQIICGYQRLLVLKQLDQEALPGLIVPAATPAAWCLQASLQDNALGRGFNPMEAALMIDRSLRHFAEEVVCRQYLPLLGLPPALSQLRIFLALLELEKPWQDLAALRRLSPPAGAALSQWAAADRQALLPWFQGAPLSHSKQLECLEYLKTLSRRADMPPSHWLARPELHNVLANPVLAGAEKTKQLLAVLRQWCLPRTRQVQEQFQRHLKALGIYQHPDIRLLPAPAFEEANFRLELRFQDRTDLNQRLQQVQEILTRPDFDAIIRL